MKLLVFAVTLCVVLAYGSPKSFSQEEVWPEHLIENFDNYQEAMEKYKQDEKYKKRQQRFRSDIFVMKILKASVRHPEILDSFELTADQRTVILQLISDYKSKESELREKYSRAEESEKLVSKKMISVNHEFTSKVCDVLVDIQLEDLIGMNILSTGVPRLLTDTKMGDALELSATQRKRIREKSDRLGKKVAEFMHKARHEAADAVYSELDQAQRQILTNIYGEKIISNYFEYLNVPTIYAHFRFLTKDDFKDQSKRGVLRTDLPELRRK